MAAKTTTANVANASASATARRWADALRERKVHVVAAVLEMVGEDAMRDIATRAAELHARDEAASLGGAFMRVLKTIVVVTSLDSITTATTTETLHDAAKRVGGERDAQRERVRIRNKTRRTISKSHRPPRVLFSAASTETAPATPTEGRASDRDEDAATCVRCS